MKSKGWRRVAFLSFFGLFLPCCILGPAVPGNAFLAGFLRIAGAIIVVLSMLVAIYVHHLFPERHDEPEDFDHLITTGPYRFLRHPFYASFLAMGIGLILTFGSLMGFICYIVMLPLWYKLARVEEEELLSYWGDEYRRYMERTPRFFPFPRMRREP